MNAYTPPANPSELMPCKLPTPLVSLCLSLTLGTVPALSPCRVEAQPFTFSLVQTNLTELDYGAVAYADLDLDGDLDLIAGGNAGREEFRPASYIALSLAEVPLSGNRWRRSFEQTSLPVQLWHSTITWIDYDLDGDLDFVMTGTSRSSNPPQPLPFEGVTRLYRNNGAGQFEDLDAGLVGVYRGAAAQGDYDNDGDLDLLISGLATPETRVTRLYRNDGGTFADADAPFRPVAFGDAQWGDYDNDGDLDLALAGMEPNGNFITLLYRNNGTSGFEEVDAGLRGLAFSDLDWGDYDNDGDLDLAITGAILDLPDFLTGVAEVYRNDGGRFTRLNNDFDGVLYGNASWGDYDNDGDLDLLLLGGDASSGRTGRIYRNEEGTFVERLALVGLTAASATWGDYDDDNDLDVLTSGTTVSFTPLTRLYRNDQITLNTVPTTPTGLQADVQGNVVTLSWGAATDDQTPAPGLTYNLRLGTAPGTANVVPPLADPASGRRWIPGRGNVDHNTSWTLSNLPLGTYYWSVQAIDHSFKGSPFAAEGSFTITTNTNVGTGIDDADGVPADYALYQSFPNPFRDATTIAYDLPAPTPVTLTIYNVLGAAVNRLVEGVQAAGKRRIVWDGRDELGQRVGAGVYFVRMQSDHASWTRKLIMLK